MLLPRLLPLLLVALAAAARRLPPQCGLIHLEGYKKAQQPFEEPLRLNWDSWSSSQLVTTIAGILLQQGLGYNVEMVELGTVAGWETSATADLYEAVSTGALRREADAPLRRERVAERHRARPGMDARASCLCRAQRAVPLIETPMPRKNGQVHLAVLI